MFNDAEFEKILTERSLIDPTTLEEAKKLKGSSSLYEALSQEKLIDVEILRSVAEELSGVPSVEIRSYEITPETIKLVPSSMAFRNRVIPLTSDNSGLVLGMFDPTDLLAMDEISTRTGVNINPKGVDPRELKLALEEYYGGHDELRSFDDGLLDAFKNSEHESMVDDAMSEMGWDEMFEGEDVPEGEVQKMQDRPTTGVIDIESGEIEIADDDALLEGLDDPISLDGAYDLEEWDVDVALKASDAESSLIVSKDAIGDFFDDEDKGGVAKVDHPPTQRVDVYDEIQRSLTDPSTPILTPNKLTDGATQEITPNILESIFDSSVREASESSLNEKTSAKPDEINRLTGVMKVKTSKKANKSAKSFEKKKGEISGSNNFEIPDGVDAKQVLESVIRLLVAKGLIDHHDLMTLMKDKL